MLRIFCEAMYDEPDEPIPRSNPIVSRIRHEIEMYGYCSTEDMLAVCDYDQLTDAELKYLEKMTGRKFYG